MAKLTLGQLQKKIERWMRTAPTQLEKYLRKGAMLATREIKERHLTGPRMAPGVGHLWQATLAVGKTGNLRRSITERVSVTRTSAVARVGSNVFYGRIHEYGLGPMPERPFVRPSVENKRPKIMDLLLKGMMEGYDRSG